MSECPNNKTRNVHLTEEVERKIADWTEKNNEELRQAKVECDNLFTRLDRKLLSPDDEGFHPESDEEAAEGVFRRRVASLESQQSQPATVSQFTFANEQLPCSSIQYYGDEKNDDQYSRQHGDTWENEAISLASVVGPPKLRLPPSLMAIRRVLTLKKAPKASEKNDTAVTAASFIPG